MACCKQFFNLVLVGKTGHGKSATGNTILGRSVFKCSNNAGSLTKDLMLESVEKENFQLNVLDTPGLFDTDKSASNNDILMKLLDIMSYCPEGIDGFFLVIKCGDRFTKEEFKTFSILKEFFGPDFLKICTVIFTFGDRFETDDDSAGKSFDDWLQESMKTNEDLRTLIEDCEKRNVLFYNNKKWKEKRDYAMNRLLSIIKQRRKTYTHASFQEAAKFRQKAVQHYKLPQLQANYQRALSLIVEVLEKAELSSESVSSAEKSKIINEIDELLAFINDESLGTQLLKDFEHKVLKVRAMFDNQCVFGEKATKIKEYLDLLKNPPNSSITLAFAVALTFITAGSVIGSLVFPTLINAAVVFGLQTVECIQTSVEIKKEIKEYGLKIAKLETELMIN